MQRVDGRFVYSASDLTNDLECLHLTGLERRVALGELQRPPRDRAAELIAGKGLEHETRFLEQLQRRHGADLVVFSARTENTLAGMRVADFETLAAMERGVRIIAQPTFFDGEFLGRADFLRRVEKPCAKWAWSYEVLDTKLALTPKPYFLIQLCNYSEHLERLQGTMPEYGYIVLGSGIEKRFRIDDYAAYYRRRKAAFLEHVAGSSATYPNECAHCSICSWSDRCASERNCDDHLSIVAWMRGDQIEKMHGAGITTIAGLAAASDEQRPYGMRQETFTKLRAQAALQHRGRTEKRYFYELLECDPKAGFELLPPPDPGDVFFDMEGDPLYAPDHGLEYLFGVYVPADESYHAFWARSDADEQAAFEQLMDFLVARRARFPQMHVYHYAPYETTALRRLMGRYASRERELDQLLRSQTFVDLYAVVRQSLRISQPSYSLKKLEPFYGMKRTTNIVRGDDSIVQFETWLATRDDGILADIERYNDDDCRSTYRLREWLLQRRAERALELGGEIPWRGEPDAKEPELDKGDELAHRLTADLPVPLSLAELRAADEKVRGRWLLGHLLEYHRREAKPAWWRLFDRYENRDLLEEFDHEAIGGLLLREDIAPYKLKASHHNFVHAFEFPDQQHNLGNSDPFCPEARAVAGELVKLDEEHNLVYLKVAGNIVPARLRALIPGGPLPTKVQREALHRVAEAWLDGTLAARFPATRDLLLRRTPRFTDRPLGAPIQPDEVTVTALGDAIRALDRSYLFVQGPPGSGKSTKGAAVIVDLLAAEKRIGILARGHKALHNLLDKVEEEVARRGQRFTGLYKSSDQNEGSEYVSRFGMVENVADAKGYAEREHQLAAGTPWLFARADLVDRYDYLFIDEAGQLALGDALACTPCAENVVLLGDPLQLAQVSQGSHPIGTDLSILEHVLADDVTVKTDRGIFLDVSYRMHPAICTFVSDAVYEGRLHADAATATHGVESRGLRGSGLRYIASAHAGNGRASIEEAEAIVRETLLLLEGEVRVHGGAPRALVAADVLVVSPYNAQRRLIRRKLAEAGLEPVRVGTVDKFQGLEAPVVFYSMATSSGEDLPRNMAFLFEKNRLNVAISRAQCMTVLVCSPRLLDVSCANPEQMALVNLLCRYVEACSSSSQEVVLAG